MSPTNSIFHSLKDQIRNVKYSIRAEAHVPGSMLPRALQNREMRRLTSLGSVVSMPAFRLVDGILTRVESIAMDLLGAPTRSDPAHPESIEAYFADEFEFTDKLFQLLKRVVDIQAVHNVFVSEQAIDAAWVTIARDLRGSTQGLAAAEGADPVLTCASVALALVRSEPVRQVGFHQGGGETNFARAPSLYCGVLVGLLIAVATCRSDTAQDGEGVFESVNSAVNARFDRFSLALACEVPALAIAAEYRKLIPFLP